MAILIPNTNKLIKSSINKHPFIENIIRVHTSYAEELVAGEFHRSMEHYSLTVVN